ncbi:MAG: hypothetical protein HDT50_02965 [Lactobacillus sp.]|nr:hypothetical protein [Lactobacillus sp.]
METILLDKAGLKKLYHQGYSDLEAMIDPHTVMLILDCHLLGLSQCRSLIIDAKRGIIISEKETTRLINQFVAKQSVGFLPARAILCAQGKKKMPCLPYVWGETELMPLGGYTRHATNWIMLNHVHYHYFATTTLIAFIFKAKQNIRFLIPVNKKTYLTNLQTTAFIYDKLHRFIKEFVAEFDLSVPTYDLSSPVSTTLVDPRATTFIFDAYFNLIVALIYHSDGCSDQEQNMIIAQQLKHRYDRF